MEHFSEKIQHYCRYCEYEARVLTAFGLGRILLATHFLLFRRGSNKNKLKKDTIKVVFLIF